MERAKKLIIAALLLLVGAGTLAYMFYREYRREQLLRREIATEAARLENWQQMAQKAGVFRGSPEDERDKHLKNLEFIEASARKAEVLGNVVNIKAVSQPGAKEESGLSVELQNVNMQRAVKYLQSIETGPFVVTKLWVYLAKDKKSWDVRANIATKN